MKSSRTWAFGIGTALLAVAFASAGEWGPPPPPPGEGPGHFGMMAKQLGLSAAQQTQIRAITEKYMEGPMSEWMQALGDARVALGAAIHDEDATDEQVQDKAAGIAFIEGKLAVERHHMALEVQQIFTPAQRTQAAQLAKEHANRPPPPRPMGPGGF